MGFPQPNTNVLLNELGLNTTAPSVAGTMATLPPVSTAQAITLGTPVQNTLSYDRILQCAIVITSATTATITCGVGSSSTPGVQTLVPSFSLAVTGFLALSLYVPAGYYATFGTTGTIVAAAAGQWQPI